MAGSIAFFDFDGTITKRDTMLELAKFHKGSVGFATGMMLISPWMVALKLKLITPTEAKEKFLQHFFGNMLAEEFDQICKDFTEKKLPSLIRKDAMEMIEWHRSEDHTIVVVSASAENWVRYWCEQNGLPLLATKLEVNSDKRISGKLSCVNCNGQEKVTRIKAKFDPGQFESIYAYGDSSGDKQMLAMATHPFYRKFTS